MLQNWPNLVDTFEFYFDGILCDFDLDSRSERWRKTKTFASVSLQSSILSFMKVGILCRTCLSDEPVISFI